MQVVEVEIDNIVGDVPRPESDQVISDVLPPESDQVIGDVSMPELGHSDFSLSVGTDTAVKSECDGLDYEQAVSSSSESVSWTSSSQLRSVNSCSVVSIKQEPEWLSSYQQTDLLSSCGSQSGDWCRADGEDVVCGVELKQKPVTSSTYQKPVRRECELVSSSSQLASTVDWLNSQTTGTEWQVGPMTVADVNRHFDKSSVTVNEVNVMSSKSVTCTCETSQLPLSTQMISPLSNSQLLLSCASVTLDGNTAVLMSQELIRCRDSVGRTCYIPRSLLLPLHSSAALNSTASLSSRSLLSSYCVDSNTSLTLSGSRTSAAKCDILPSLCDVATGPSTKPVITSVLNGDITTGREMCTEPIEPSAVKVSVTDSTALPCTGALTTVTTSSLSCPSQSSMSTSTARSNQQMILASDKHRDQLRVTSVLDSAVIKPRLLVPVCSISSPHITVLPIISTQSRTTAPVRGVLRTQRPTCRLTAKLLTSSSLPTCHMTTNLPTSSKSPLYFVMGGNNQVISASSSNALMEVVLVPGMQKTLCSMQTATTTAVNSRFITSSSPQSVICQPLLNRITKSVQMSRSGSQVSLLRPQNTALSTMTSKPSSLQQQAHAKTISSSSNLNVFATKIGNQTVIVDIGSLSSSSAAPVKPSVTTVTFAASSVNPKDMKTSKSTSTAQHMTAACANVSAQSSALCTDCPTVATDEVPITCTQVIRYCNWIVFFFKLVRLNFLHIYFFCKTLVHITEGIRGLTMY